MQRQAKAIPLLILLPLFSCCKGESRIKKNMFLRQEIRKLKKAKVIEVQIHFQVYTSKGIEKIKIQVPRRKTQRFLSAIFNDSSDAFQKSFLEKAFGVKVKLKAIGYILIKSQKKDHKIPICNNIFFIRQTRAIKYAFRSEMLTKMIIEELPPGNISTTIRGRLLSN